MDSTNPNPNPNPNESEKTRRRPVTTVKVVASRYAQALQRSNLEAKGARNASSRGKSNGSGAAANGARTSTVERTRGAGSSAKIRANSRSHTTIVQSTRGTPRAQNDHKPTALAARTSAFILGSTLTRDVSSNDSRAGNSTAKVTSTGATTTGLDAKERLRLYRANNKGLHRAAGASRKVSSNSTAGTHLRSVATRPAFPERVTPPVEKVGASKPSNSGAKTVSPSRRPISPASSSASRLGARPKVAKGSTTTQVLGPSRVASSQPDEEELELLECMYYQLCLSEVRANEAFQHQEKHAERQIIAAWQLLETKLQLLHDTSVRLDDELHTYNVEEHLAAQAGRFSQLASRINLFTENMDVVCRALAASLERMPTPGIVSAAPELKRRIGDLSTELEGLVTQLHSDGVGRSISDALTFGRGMEHTAERLSTLLLQVTNLLEELQNEVNAETSLAVHRIQNARMETLTRHDDDLWIK